MTTELFTNEASTTVSSGGTTAPAAGTVETWTVASSASFPAASATATPPTQFHVADPSSTATAAEIIAVTNVSGTTWTVTRGAESTTPVAHSAGFTVQQVITAAGLTAFLQSPYQPWQLRPEDYGAKGDGFVINDATVGAGALTTLNSASGKFTQANTNGAHIMLNGGQGNDAQPLITTLTYVSATQATMAAPATGAVTNGSAVIGHDDTAAFNSAMTAIKTYALATGGNFHAQLMLANKIYCLATPPTVTSGIVGATCAQIPIPFPAAAGTTQKLMIDIIGVGAADACMYFNSTVPDVRGSVLVSMCIPPFAAGTNPEPSIVGLQYANDGSLTSGFANVKVWVDGVSGVIPFLAPTGAWDFRYCASAGGGKFGAFAFGAPAAGAYNNLQDLPSLPGQTGGNSFGIYMPRIGNNADCTVTSFVSEGFTFGAIICEHSTFLRLACIYPVAGISARGGGAHGAYIGYACVENGFSALQCTEVTAFPLVIGLLDCEGMTNWHVQDTNGFLRGQVLVHTNNTTPPLVLAGTGMKVIWDHFGPGRWLGTDVPAVPAVPSSGVAQQNTSWRDAAVSVKGGTVSAVVVDGATLASATGVTVIVPAGKSITVTYSVAPTWEWVRL